MWVQSTNKRSLKLMQWTVHPRKRTSVNYQSLASTFTFCSAQHWCTEIIILCEWWLCLDVYRAVLQSCAVDQSQEFWWATGQSNLAGRMEDTACSCMSLKTKLWKLLLWPAKFDCPMTCQKFSLLATAHDCETGLWNSLPFCLPSLIVQWPPEFFTFSYCAWMWNWFITLC